MPIINVPAPQQQLVDQFFKTFAREIDLPDFAKTKDADALKKMRRDEVFAKALDQLLDLVAGTSWYLEPGDERSRPLIPYFRALIKRICDFTSMRRALALAIFEGTSWLRMITPDEDRFVQLADDEKPRKWWWPELMHVGADAIRRFVEHKDPVSTPDGESFVPPSYPWATHDPTINKWLRVEDLSQYVRLAFQNDHHSRGYGHGMLEACWMPWHAKKHLERQMLKGAVRYAFPWIAVKLDTKAMFGDSGTGSSAFDSPEEAQQEFLDRLEETQESHNAVLVFGDNADITPISFDGRGAEGMRALIQYYNDTLVEFILGASMPSGGGGESGSLARAAVEGGVISQRVALLRQNLEEAISRDLIRAIWRFNRHNFAEIVDEETGLTLSTMQPPTFRIGREKSDDYAQNIERMVAFSQLQVIDEMGQPQPAGIKIDQAYELGGFEQPDEGDPIVGMPAPQPQPMGMPTEEEIPLQAGGEVPQERIDAFQAKEAAQADVPAFFAHLRERANKPARRPRGAIRMIRAAGSSKLRGVS